jgi:hypothetical protein
MAEPRDVTIAVVEEELPAAHAHAGRHGWRLAWLPNDLLLHADGTHPADKSRMRLQGNLADYRALPPIWTCYELDANGTAKPRFPKGGSVPGVGASMFIDPGVICAPFNRLAYATPEYQGPHGNWGGPAKWLDVRGYVRATCLGEMLAQIILHLQSSPGWRT